MWKYRLTALKWKLKGKISYWRVVLPWKLKMWLFSWRLDEEGDVMFVVAQRLAFVKYKESTLVRWVNASNFRFAPKYLTEEKQT